MANIMPTYWTGLTKIFLVGIAKFFEFDYELLPNAQYSPDLAASRYFMFPNLNKWFRVKRQHWEIEYFVVKKRVCYSKYQEPSDSPYIMV